ncbi:hypothetical protein FN846DRAFT_914541 [Sphaerosporella brunnea]|uniref:Uncharacterized protein n=1 Tax=Sphaerosporella brunnea TaxID=1250544 RepID=A0A5J5EBY0_9PEZI|nr:hypothetical protein FN846DRAFT_914541 [Sphaerosporella brunnea]
MGPEAPVHNPLLNSDRTSSHGLLMVSTRAASQAPTAQAPTAQATTHRIAAAQISDADLTDIEELKRQSAGSTETAATERTAGTAQTVSTSAGKPTDPSPPRNEPQNTALPTAEQIALLLHGLQALAQQPPTLHNTFLSGPAQAVTALTTHLATPDLTSGAHPGLGAVNSPVGRQVKQGPSEWIRSGR